MMKKIILFGLFAMAVFSLIDFKGDQGVIAVEETIEQGDTLYQAASRAASPKDNINEVVFNAMQENGIKDPGDIQPGQKIILRVHKK